MKVAEWVINDKLNVKVEKKASSFRLFFDKNANLARDYKKLYSFLKENSISNVTVFVFRANDIGLETLRSQIKERVLSLEDFEVKEKV